MNTATKTRRDASTISGRQGLAIVLISVGLLWMAGCQEPAQSPQGPEQPAQATATAVLSEGMVARAQQIVQSALTDADAQARANAIEVVATTGQVRLMSTVRRLLADKAVPVRFLAVLAVADMQYALAKNEIIALLKDPNENVRIAAAYAMTRFGHREYFTVFRNAIASEDQTVRANAALLLGRSRDRSATKYLYWALRRKDSTDKVILQAAESIAMLGDEQIYPKLWTRLISAYADDRVLGIRAMGALGTEQARNALVTMLEDDILEVRLAAARELGALRDPIGEPEVLAALDDKTGATHTDTRATERVKVMTALAIGEIGTTRLTKHLPALLADPSKAVRIAAAKAVFQTSGAK